jgi:hypothetical protein
MPPTKWTPTRWPRDLRHQGAPRLRSGRFGKPGIFPMNRQNPTTRLRMAAVYAPGTVRARRWHGDSDVRGYGRARFQRPPQNRPIAAFGQAATGRARNELARGTAIGARWHGQILMAPRRNSGACGGYAPTCCGRLCQSAPPPTLAVRCLYVTKDESRTRRPASPYGASTPCLEAHRRELRKGAFSLSPLSLGLGLARIRMRAGVAVMRRCRVGRVSIRDRRPVRPLLVVNPGGGAAAPWASWPQPSSANNFPAAARLPRGTNSLRFQVLHAVATAARCDQPIPRRPDHNKDALARPCSTRKENHHG